MAIFILFLFCMCAFDNLLELKVLSIEQTATKSKDTRLQSYNIAVSSTYNSLWPVHTTIIFWLHHTIEKYFLTGVFLVLMSMSDFFFCSYSFQDVFSIDWRPGETILSNLCHTPKESVTRGLLFTIIAALFVFPLGVKRQCGFFSLNFLYCVLRV